MEDLRVVPVDVMCMIREETKLCVASVYVSLTAGSRKTERDAAVSELGYDVIMCRQCAL